MKLRDLPWVIVKKTLYVLQSAAPRTAPTARRPVASIASTPTGTSHWSSHSTSKRDPRHRHPPLEPTAPVKPVANFETVTTPRPDGVAFAFEDPNNLFFYEFIVHWVGSSSSFWIPSLLLSFGSQAIYCKSTVNLLYPGTIRLIKKCRQRYPN